MEEEENIDNNGENENSNSKENEEGEYMVSESDLLDVYDFQYNDLFSKILSINETKFFELLQEQVSLNLRIMNKWTDVPLASYFQDLIAERYKTDKKRIEKDLETVKTLSENEITYLDYSNCYIHCHKNLEVFHKCGNKLILYNGFIYCLHCNKIYTEKQIKLYCSDCDEIYYSRLRENVDDSNKYHIPVVFAKNHCPSDYEEEEKIKCFECGEDLYCDLSEIKQKKYKYKYNKKNDSLKEIICTKCKLLFNTREIKFSCSECGEEFMSDAKLYIDFPVYKKNMLYLIHSFRKERMAKPLNLEGKKCDCDINLITKYYHDEDKGVLFEGCKDLKNKIICDQCFYIFNYEEIEWKCPICGDKYGSEDEDESKNKVEKYLTENRTRSKSSKPKNVNINDEIEDDNNNNDNYYYNNNNDNNNNKKEAENEIKEEIKKEINRNNSKKDVKNEENKININNKKEKINPEEKIENKNKNITQIKINNYYSNEKYNYRSKNDRNNCLQKNNENENKNNVKHNYVIEHLNSRRRNNNKNQNKEKDKEEENKKDKEQKEINNYISSKYVVQRRKYNNNSNYHSNNNINVSYNKNQISSIIINRRNDNNKKRKEYINNINSSRNENSKINNNNNIRRNHQIININDTGKKIKRNSTIVENNKRENKGHYKNSDNKEYKNNKDNKESDIRNDIINLKKYFDDCNEEFEKVQEFRNQQIQVKIKEKKEKEEKEREEKEKKEKEKDRNKEIVSNNNIQINVENKNHKKNIVSNIYNFNNTNNVLYISNKKVKETKNYQNTDNNNNNICYNYKRQSNCSRDNIKEKKSIKNNLSNNRIIKKNDTSKKNISINIQVNNYNNNKENNINIINDNNKIRERKKNIFQINDKKDINIINKNNDLDNDENYKIYDTSNDLPNDNYKIYDTNDNTKRNDINNINNKKEENSNNELSENNNNNTYQEANEDTQINSEQNSTYSQVTINSNNYKNITVLGQGSFGKIYLVEDIKTKEQYAMKKLILGDKLELRDNQDEYNMIMQITTTYPELNIIHVYGTETKNFDEYNFVFYVLMEVANCDWEKELLNRAKHKAFYTEEEIFDILQNLVDTFAYLQQIGICHRDIKPQNILCFGEKGYKISDFGEAKYRKKWRIQQSSVNYTSIQTVRGTELYMSPILYKALKTSPNSGANHNVFKSDVFSLGMCFLFASCLDYKSLYEVRKINNIKKLLELIESCVKGKYSKKFIDILLKMLQLNEKERPDFIELSKII